MRQFVFSRSGLTMLGFLAVGGYFLWTEHQAHTITALPWLLIGGCLVMHLFMHGGHGGHSGHGGHGGGADDGSGGDEPESDSRRAP